MAVTRGRIALEERTEYVLAFDRPLSASERQRLTEMGGETIRDDLAVLSFGNYVGSAEFAGVRIEVVSTKIGPGGVSRILEEISALAASLIFAARSRAGFEGLADWSAEAPVPYHQLQFLRERMVRAKPGERLQDWLSVIELHPTRRFEPERPVMRLGQVRRLDQRAVRSIFARLDRLVPVPAGSPLAAHTLAQKLTFGDPPRAHMPERVAAPRGRLSFDTAENRFVKHVIGECLGLVYRFVGHPRLHDSLRADCRQMLGILEEHASAPFLVEAGRLAGLQAPTQALAKADGYRDVFAFWDLLSRHMSLPLSAAETTHLLEGRDMATLYEYWVFVKIVELLAEITGDEPAGRVAFRRDEFGETLTLGFGTAISPGITVRYNPSFRRSARTAYSTPMRPDVTIEIGGAAYVFDAKYRLDRFDADEDDADDGTATYKRADLYKMHTYRDAIAGIRAAFVVYPGTEFVFFERTGARCEDPTAITVADGVGAVPLRPADAEPADQLRRSLRRLLSLSPLPAAAAA